MADARDWILARLRGEKRAKKAHQPAAPMVSPDRARLTDA
jgi:hypothetical protein